MTPDAPAGYGPAKKSLAPDSEAAGERRRQLGEFRESLCGPLLAWAEFRALLSGISGGAGPIALRGVADAQRAHFACALEQCSGRRVLYIAPNEYDAQAAFADFYALYGHEAVYFPAREIVLYDIEARNHDIAYRRLRALDRLLSGDCRVCVTSAEAAAQFIPPPRLFSSMIMSASEGDAVDLDFAARRLVEMGYERVQTVEARGAFAIRGGLLDIYPVDYEYALRIELFGDEIDSMRLFDAASQRSVEQVRRARIIPARDTAYREADREGIVSRIRREMAAGGRGAPSGRSMPAVEADIQKFAESHYFPGIDRYLAYIYDGQPTLLDYFFAGEAAGGAAAGGAGAGEGMAGGAAGGGGAAGRGAAGSAVAMAPGAGGGMVGGTGASGGATGSAASVGAPPPLVVIDDPPRAAQKLETVLSEHAELCSGFMEKGKLLASAYKVWLDFAELAQRLPRAGLVTIGLSRTAREDELLGGRAAEFDVSGKTHVSPRGNVAMLLDEMRGRLREQWAVVLLTKSGMKAERLQDALRGAGLPVRRPAGNAGAPSAGAPASGAANGAEGIVALPVAALPAAGFVNVMAGAALSSGFEYPAIKLMVISDAEFQSQERQAKKNRRAPKGSKIEYFTDLALGDYVVHQSHGVGVYAGLERLEVDGAVREYLKVQYRDGDYLYIPTDQLDLVQKYIGSEGRAPRVNSLDSAEWSKTKKRVKESLKKLAAELILIYARRRDARGYAFSKDTVWQGQFEEQFPYEETGDQLQSIEEIKRDMESPRVMDRLLCGDVGFGKTEVAIRAVFKAVSDGAQVVFLVPTTVLAQQHYLTFRERFKDFPISIDVLSRFRTKKELDGIAKALEQGGIDVIIGTHRIILNKDIRFKNLRLLIVDEEQRFGVAHKERLKLMKPDVDVLSMSATPIPRTLHMSMTKIRDISVLKDPPEERFPVQTFVMEYDEGVVREAILREVARGGQVFYLYNRVMGIDIKMMQLKDMLPDGVRIAYAHGRMGDRELEDIMLAFIERRFDVLVCTTIIESGLDMPNVNTIVVEDADRMGLSQLYQLRGRVGRSNRLAYAYITHRRDKVLTEESEKRLKAIREFTELGAGFKIAMRDMEIRGIGNLLGTEQHGHMESVGYDMYCRLLDEAVRELERAGGPAAGGAWGASADGGVDAGGANGSGADGGVDAGGAGARGMRDARAPGMRADGQGAGAGRSGGADGGGSSGAGVFAGANRANGANVANGANGASAGPPRGKVPGGSTSGADGEAGGDGESGASVDIKISAYLDGEYIEDEAQRLEIYQKIAAIRDETDAADVTDELYDRFAELPEAAGNLIKIARIKALAKKCGISSVVERNGTVTLYLAKNGQFNVARLSEVFQKYRRQALFSAGAPPYIALKPEPRQGAAAASRQGAAGDVAAPSRQGVAGAAIAPRQANAKGAEAAYKPAAARVSVAPSRQGAAGGAAAPSRQGAAIGAQALPRQGVTGAASAGGAAGGAAIAPRQAAAMPKAPADAALAFLLDFARAL